MSERAEPEHGPGYGTGEATAEDEETLSPDEEAGREDDADERK